MKYIRLLILMYVFFHPDRFDVKAQTDTLKINYPGYHKPFKAFIDEIEKSSQIRFFYNSLWIDTIFVDGEFNQISLKTALDKILIPKGLFYFIDDQKNVIITKDKALQYSLSEEFIESDEIYNNLMYMNQTGKDSILKYNVNQDKSNSDEITLGVKSDNGKSAATILGFVRDKETGEPIIGATVFIEELKTGVSTDIEGYFMIIAKKGNYHITIKAIGMGTVQKSVKLYSDGQMNINMNKELIAIHEIVIKEDKYNNIRGMQIGLEKLTMKEIKEIPLAVGERDLLKATLLLPGIQSVGESAGGYNVRGGAADQNLFLINLVPIFNTSHMFGFFSSFNTDAIKDFVLFKSNIPVEYGGRISSVFDIRTRQGNKKNFSMKGGISPITAKLLFEGPIIKDRSSFIIGIRSTYSNWILKQIDNPEIRNSNVYFNDITANISHKINDKNHINAFGYFSIDNYRLITDINYNYYNYGASLNWKHISGKRLISNTTAVISNYHLEVTDEHQAEYSYQFKHNVRYYEINQAYNYLYSSKHEFKFGFNSIFYAIDPGAYNPINNESIYKERTYETETALESAIYFGDRFEINQKLSVEGGIRLSLYNYLGPKTVYSYRENEPLSSNSVTDTSTFSRLELVKNYSGADFRLSFRYLVNLRNSFKLGYSRINQYLFILTNSISISPTDRWKLCDPFAKPIIGDQFNFGYYRNFENTNFEASIEMYYKANKNMPDFKNGADLMKNENIERSVISGFGRNYGIEFMIKKNNGRFTGWFNYAFAKSELKFPVKSVSETINRGEFYPTNYDKPHNFNLVANLRGSRRLSVSSNFTYSTGCPFTPPASKYILDGYTVINFSDRNAERITDYWRLDFSINLEGNLKRKKLAHSFWMFTVYNLTGRKNAYSVFFNNDKGNIKGYKISVYGMPVFTLSYNFKLGNYASD